MFLADREIRQVLWTGFKSANSDRNGQHYEISLSAELTWIGQALSWSTKNFCDSQVQRSWLLTHKVGKGLIPPFWQHLPKQHSQKLCF